MTVRRLGGVLALLGGLAWLVATYLGTSHGQWSTLRWSGLGLVLAAFACLGLNLLKGQARWLDLVVGLAFPLLAWTVYEVLGDVVTDARNLHGFLGAVFVGVGGLLALTRRPGDAEPSSSGHAPSHRA